MQVEILSIPESARPWTRHLVVGTLYPLTYSDDNDRYEFPYDDIGHGLGDLILNGIEFKVVHEKA